MSALCANCGKHVGTVNWGGEEPFFAMSHGFTTLWCKCCVLKVQLSYAENQAKRVKALRKELAKKTCNRMKVGT